MSHSSIELTKHDLQSAWKGAMQASIVTPKWFSSSKKALPVQVIKFNRYTMVFNSPRRLKLDQVILANLACGNHSVRELKSRVTKCERSGQYFQSHIKFVIERPDKQPYRELIAVLKSIEASVPATIRSPLHMSA